MRCTTVRARLVAWQDDELSPGEHTQVVEHLAGCSACRDAEAALRRATPQAPTEIPADVLARLEAATQVDLVLEAAASGRSRWPDPPLWRRVLQRELELPAWAVLAAVALLALSAGWAWRTQESLDAARAELASRDATYTATPVGAPSVDLPAGQFRPASYQPTTDPDYPH